jgi:hypothetical protein
VFHKIKKLNDKMSSSSDEKIENEGSNLSSSTSASTKQDSLSKTSGVAKRRRKKQALDSIKKTNKKITHFFSTKATTATTGKN